MPGPEQSDDLFNEMEPPSSGDTSKGIGESLGNTVDGALGDTGIGNEVGGLADGVLKEVGLEDDKGDLDISSITNSL